VFVVTDSAGAETAMLKLFDAVAFCASLTRALNENAPDRVGVPLMLPLPLRDTPSGKLPDSTDHVYGEVPPVALRDAEYAAPTAPPGSEFVLTASVAELIEIENALDRLAFAASTTRAEILNAPARVGVPLNDPPALSATPSGRLPDSIVHVYGAVPPAAESDPEYAVPTIPAGSEFVLMLNAGAVIPMLNDFATLAFDASVTRTENVKLPARVGVPEIVPPAVRARPSGRLPESTDHEYGTVPPVAVSEPEYATPTVPFDSVFVETASPAGAIVTLNPFVAVAFAASVTFSVNTNVSATVGVPISEPFALSEMPAGRLPDSTLHA
jgi:hypothetical protein